MKLIFEGHDYRYAVEQSLLAFFPNERPVYDGEDANLARVGLAVEGQTAHAATSLTVGGKTAEGTATPPPRWTTMDGSGLSSGR